MVLLSLKTFFLKKNYLEILSKNSYYRHDNELRKLDVSGGMATVQFML